MTASAAPVWDPLDELTIADPYPVYRQMREHAPVMWHDSMRSWVLTRYDDCREVLRDYRLFALDERRVGAEIDDDWLQIQAVDPPEKSELRGAFKTAIMAMDVDAVTARAATVLRERLSNLSPGDPIDVVSELAAPLALQVISEFMGICDSTLDWYEPIFRRLTLNMDARIDEERVGIGTDPALDLRQRMTDWLGNPEAGGLIGRLRDDPSYAAAPRPYVRNTLCAMFNAGYSTAFASTASIILTTIEQPQVLADCVDETVLVTAADELIRYISPAQGTSRWATQDTTIGGVPIKQGDALISIIAAANRDPEVFPHPDSIELRRRPNKHLGLGWGAHVCAGAPLANAWVTAVLRELAGLNTSLRVIDEPRYMHAATLRSLERLNITTVDAQREPDRKKDR